jgi:hypothetical protein
MNAPAIQIASIAFGTPLEGGFYAGRIRLPDGEYAVIVSPRAAGDHDDIKWGPVKRLAGALSFFDGLANTKAMAEAGSKAAKWALGLSVGGFSDWYIPSRDELELCYRNLKPTDQENWCYRGDNPSSVPVGYAYMPDAPAQTEASAFRKGSAEAFDDTWYWTSTQSAGGSGYAWYQGFGGGGQGCYGKDGYGRVRAVRRVKV